MPFKLSPSKICLFLTLLLGILIFYPRSNFQVRLAQGDHGRDLYSFQQTAQGAIPIHDYWTQNGPLMPYYYALIYKIFGSTIQSTLLGYYFLVLCAGLMIFLIAREFLSPLAALAGVLWYWTFRGEEFFYTYNHIGAVVCVLLSIYCLVRHIKNNTIR
ncbi:MAG: glycosyltransferase family 39 protein, partial [Candidatus Omnitrophica bacterium]|nr:glycosyltransferase family 39 protein [Candidatus Omnitrophota bacterium]